MAAKPAYAQAMQADAIPVDAAATDGTTLLDLLKRPSIRKAVSYADQLAAEKGEQSLSAKVYPKTPESPPLPEPVASGQFTPEQWEALRAKNPGLPAIPASAEAPTPDPVDIADLHNIKLKLDDMLGYARNRGQLPDGTPATKTMLRGIQDTRGALLDIMDANAPEYAAARQGFAGSSRVQDALQQGQEDFAANVRPSEAQANRAALETDSERAFYDRGMLAAARDVIEKNAANPDIPMASRQVNVVQRLLGNKAQGEKIASLFPDRQSYQGFVRQMEQEAQYPQTAKFFQNQSSTASQLAEGNQRPGLFRDLATAGMGSKYALYNLARRAAETVGLGGKAGLSPAVANEIGQRAVLTGPALQEWQAQLAASQGPALARQAAIQGGAGRTVAAAPEAVAAALRALSNKPNP